MTERWQQILRIMDEAFGDYLTELVALRKRIVVDLKRKLSDRQVLDRMLVIMFPKVLRNRPMDGNRSLQAQPRRVMTAP